MENATEWDTISIDVNSDDFYNRFQEENESDLARIKKSVEIVRQLRLSAAEVEVETAALLHAKLFQNIVQLKSVEYEVNEEISELDFI